MPVATALVICAVIKKHVCVYSVRVYEIPTTEMSQEAQQLGGAWCLRGMEANEAEMTAATSVKLVGTQVSRPPNGRSLPN